MSGYARSYGAKRIPPHQANDNVVVHTPPRSYYWLCMKHGNSTHLTPVKGKFVVPTCPCCNGVTVQKTDKIKVGNKAGTLKGAYCGFCDQRFF